MTDNQMNLQLVGSRLSHSTWATFYKNIISEKKMYNLRVLWTLIPCYSFLKILAETS